MSFLSTAVAEAAETATETAAETLELTEQQATILAGALLGVALTVILIIALVWFVFQVIADWKIFTKAGQAGWKSLIPFYNYYVEYDICWNGLFGLGYVVLLAVANSVSSQDPSTALQVLLAVAGIGAIVLHCIESVKLAKAFGKETGFAVCLILFGPIARLVLGFGSAKYVGKPE